MSLVGNCEACSRYMKRFRKNEVGRYVNCSNLFQPDILLLTLFKGFGKTSRKTIFFIESFVWVFIQSK